ncbi:aldo/keto reductase [Pseudoxanthomonas dokdonensis]|uniref:Aldo/keto reductase n=1 Tax=Pseudoxanthomonas dokdonensis TaxID=344882 RepID=A0A0R0D154_9GAMM|nr:aldo/keto reductase [Pseudoxanthomonas dokdonensis]KRG71112.1 aldo/keto reductase [Pseudoxanthomonas dokdonensis]
MVTRRKFLASSALAAAGLGLAACRDAAHAESGQTRPGPSQSNAASEPAGQLKTRVIPSSGERLPVIGMGTSGSFQVGDSAAERDPLRDVLRAFAAAGATVIDTAPTYGGAEPVLGALLAEQALTARMWLATKLSGVNGREAGLAQFAQSLRDLRTDQVALLQVHNLGDLNTQLAVARELKDQGRTRYVGMTHYVEGAQPELARVMREHKPDFVQINYSVSARGAEREVLPLAQDLGIAVIINRAFDDGKVFARVKDMPLPGWAAEAGIDSWAQALLKFALSHPAVTVVIPATSKLRHQRDNLRAGLGADLTQAQRQSLIALLA